MVRRRLLALLLVALAALLAVTTSAASAPGLTHAQRLRTDKLISEFENSTPVIQYCYVVALEDVRGFTVGRAGFTPATGDLLEGAERYTDEVPDNPLGDLLPRLRQAAASGDGSTDGLEGLPRAGRDRRKAPRQGATQDAVFARESYAPAVKLWRKYGLELPLSLASIYDAAI